MTNNISVLLKKGFENNDWAKVVEAYRQLTGRSLRPQENTAFGGRATQRIAIGLIDKAEYNHECRQANDFLVESVKKYRDVFDGPAVPVFLKKKPGGRYKMVAGHRRLDACKELGMEYIHAFVLPDDVDDAEIFGELDGPGVKAHKVRERVHAFKMSKDGKAVPKGLKLKRILETISSNLGDEAIDWILERGCGVDGYQVAVSLAEHIKEAAPKEPDPKSDWAKWVTKAMKWMVRRRKVAMVKGWLGPNTKGLIKPRQWALLLDCINDGRQYRDEPYRAPGWNWGR